MPNAEIDDTSPIRDAGDPAVTARVRRKSTHLWAGSLLLVGLASIFLLAPFSSNSQTLSGVRDSLDQQQGAVSAMAAASTALSAALSVVPGDAMTPIAEQLAELSGWFIVIIGAIILQKLLLTTSGFIAFTFILPLACVLGIAFAYSGRVILRAIALKLATFGVVLFLAVPGSIVVSGMLTDLHTDLSQTATDKPAAATPATPEKKPKEDQAPKDLFGQAQKWLSDIGTSVGNTVEKAIAAADQFRQDAVDQFNQYLEKIALFIITTCVMPILVFLLFGWVIKLLFNIDVGVNRTAHVIQSSTTRAVRRMNRGASHLAARREGPDE